MFSPTVPKERPNSQNTWSRGYGISLDGQYFWGWSDGTTVHVPGSTLTNVRDDLTLTATWGDHPLPTLPNTGLDASLAWAAAFAAMCAALLGVALMLRARRRDTLDS